MFCVVISITADYVECVQVTLTCKINVCRGCDVYRELTSYVALELYVALNYVAKVNSYSSGKQATVDLYQK
jgi:uncharacterized alkaline shock family protein YloU